MKKLFLNFLKTLLFLIFSSIIHANADDLFNKGKVVFLEAGNCATCHALSDAGSNAMIGPNLNEIRPTKDQLINTITVGIGVMQAFEGILSSEEIEAVAHYVSITSNN